jgi:hypothetical protein
MGPCCNEHSESHGSVLLDEKGRESSSALARLPDLCKQQIGPSHFDGRVVPLSATCGQGDELCCLEQCPRPIGPAVDAVHIQAVPRARGRYELRLQHSTTTTSHYMTTCAMVAARRMHLAKFSQRLACSPTPPLGAYSVSLHNPEIDGTPFGCRMKYRNRRSRARKTRSRTRPHGCSS